MLTTANNGVGGVVTYTYNYHKVSCANSTCPYFAGVATNLRHAVVRTQATDELTNSLYTDYYYGPTNPGSNAEWGAVANDGGFLGFQEVQTTSYATNSTNPKLATDCR